MIRVENRARMIIIAHLCTCPTDVIGCGKMTSAKAADELEELRRQIAESSPPKPPKAKPKILTPAPAEPKEKDFFRDTYIRYLGRKGSASE
jgi:hypothetical protein